MASQQRIDGTIPAGSNFPASLDDLNLRDNGLSGTIPDLSNLDNLTRLRLHNNSLSGEVPPTLGGLDSLRQLWLHNEDATKTDNGNNGFTSIASGVGDLSDTLIEIALRGNSWSEDACVPAVLRNVATNDYEEAGIPVCDEETTAGELEVGTPSVSNANPAPGATFALSATVSNTGEGESAATTLRYYRSTDATIATSDTEVGTDAVGVLAVSGTSDHSISLTAPLTTGIHYYGACVDAVTDESDTTNNCSASVVVDVEDTTPHPDLRVETPSVDGREPGDGCDIHPVGYGDQRGRRRFGGGRRCATTGRRTRRSLRRTRRWIRIQSARSRRPVQARSRQTLRRRRQQERTTTARVWTR